MSFYLFNPLWTYSRVFSILEKKGKSELSSLFHTKVKKIYASTADFSASVSFSVEATIFQSSPCFSFLASRA